MHASQRKKSKKITRLTRPDGTVTEDNQEMASMTTDFYKSLYRSEEIANLDEVTEVIPNKVKPDMNDKLLKAFKGEEVKAALFQMFPTKSPGPDGFPAHFFETHWEICGEEVTSAVLRVLERRDDMSDINQTFVVLIPKVASLEELGQFRPISLCNVIYKIASKVMANRLKICLPEIIAGEQSAFVPGRLITDNIIMAYECLHFMKRNMEKKNRYCALELDMRKTYDRLEWRYLEAVMIKLGFHRCWVQMIMQIVKLVSFQELFNGGKLQQFLPKRGVRQGDPISPYLFLLAAEGLSCLLKHHSLSSGLHGLMVAPSAPAVSYLLFADDSVFLFKADVESAEKVQQLLDLYCMASGQCVNRDKSSIFFSKGCPGSLRESVKGALNVHNETLNEKYLGMPSDVGRSRGGAFRYIKDRIWSRIQGWLEKLLSSGKDILIKSVVQAIPIFSMACFKLPRGLCHHINALIRKFWWGVKRVKGNLDGSHGKKCASQRTWEALVFVKSNCSTWLC
jgi:hypothetical protein